MAKLAAEREALKLQVSQAEEKSTMLEEQGKDLQAQAKETDGLTDQLRSARRCNRTLVMQCSLAIADCQAAAEASSTSSAKAKGKASPVKPKASAKAGMAMANADDKPTEQAVVKAKNNARKSVAFLEDFLKTCGGDTVTEELPPASESTKAQWVAEELDAFNQDSTIPCQTHEGIKK
eukprot:gnl/MRDRNA2_/MRDRNA2_302650_c0_seq1.p1 gnl/MRDRNA2_/MRDRNA2_302650_c0~~gnl/MRDRNA2_/MRDRNA2_302650_c0_seq1.p1  ORF type:complete len:203 (+),score=71.93 gnl/MRDRNA2_/MRDRNA2_302650_c0_seq1:76-609(+)